MSERQFIKSFDNTDTTTAPEREDYLTSSLQPNKKRALDVEPKGNSYYEMVCLMGEMVNQLKELNLYMQEIVGEKLNVNSD